VIFSRLNLIQLKQLFLLFTIAIILFGSCKKDNNPAQFFIKCKIDGQDYRPNGCANCMRGQLLDDTVFMMNANADFQTVSIGVIQKPSITTKAYILDRVGSGGSYKNSTTTDDVFRTNSSNNGQLIITTIDKENKIISGTFYFKAYNAFQNKNITISNGEFRLRYTDN
jgi:hypothetical protein